MRTTGLRSLFFGALFSCVGATALSSPLEASECCEFLSCASWRNEFELDYFHAWRAKRETPALITTAPTLLLTPQSLTSIPKGALPFAQNLRALFGGGEMGHSPRPGFHGSFSLWRGNWLGLSIEGFWVREETNHGKLLTSSENPDLGVPMIFPLIGSQTTISQPRYFGTTLFTQAKAALSNELWSVESLVRWRFLRKSSFSLDLIAGYHSSHINDTIDLTASGTLFSLTSDLKNRFTASNHFQGGLLGLSTAVNWCRWTLSLTGKVSFGKMNSRVKISGGYSSSPSEELIVGFVQDSNRGTHRKTEWEAVSELTAKVGYQFNNWLGFSLGYMAVYWPKVFLAGRQIDPAITVNQTVAAPKVMNRFSSFWVQGVTAGLHLMF